MQLLEEGHLYLSWGLHHQGAGVAMPPPFCEANSFKPAEKGEKALACFLHSLFTKVSYFYISAI